MTPLGMPSGPRALNWTARDREAAASPTSTAVAVNSVTKSFLGWRPFNLRPRRPVLSDVSFTVGFGEIAAIMGPNGAGKTTLLEIVAMLVEPTSGSVEVCGRDVTWCPADARAMLGYSGAAGHGFYGRLSARGNLEFFAVLNNIPRDEAWRRAGDWLDLVGLGDAMSARVETFSEGMRQRLSLARALIADPAVLLLDEPTRSVDPSFRHTLQRLLQRWCGERSRRSVLMVTHDFDEAEALCNRVYLLDAGRLRWEGSPHAVRGMTTLHAKPGPSATMVTSA